MSSHFSQVAKSNPDCPKHHRRQHALIVGCLHCGESTVELGPIPLRLFPASLPSGHHLHHLLHVAVAWAVCSLNMLPIIAQDPFLLVWEAVRLHASAHGSDRRVQISGIARTSMYEAATSNGI